MNPFDLPGPAFLVFYLLLALAVFFTVQQVVRVFESRAVADATPRLTDPLLIAYLRGGDREAISTALVSLVDRDLLIIDEEHYATAKSRPDLFSMRPLERAALQSFTKRGYLMDAYTDAPILAACKEYRTKLEEMGLLIGEAARAKRILLWGVAAIFLGLVAVVKIEVASARGHSNIGFLVMMAIAACYILIIQIKGRTAKRGEVVLADLRTLFDRLRTAPIRAHSQSGEAAFAAAVFGTGILPSDVFPFVIRLMPPAPAPNQKKGSWWNNSNCSSSCGSSCGGGGCGGGCGGCGG
jgi:uncharacterized protein (TIGR04222 family)